MALRLRRIARKSVNKKAYVARPSQITRRKPSVRLLKRRTENVRRPAKGYFPNPETQNPLLRTLTHRPRTGAGKLKPMYAVEAAQDSGKIKRWITFGFS